MCRNTKELKKTFFVFFNFLATNSLLKRSYLELLIDRLNIYNPIILKILMYGIEHIENFNCHLFFKNLN